MSRDAPRPMSRAGRVFSALSHRNFRLFWTGQLVSLVGTWMQSVAQAWLILQLTDNPLALGVAAACQFTPILVFGLFGGIVADVLPKRRTLMILQVAALAQAVVLGLLAVTGLAQVWHVYVLATVLGFVSAVEMPVRQSFTVEMVGREDIANAVALNSASFNASRIVGPAIAGLLIGTLGLGTAFLFNAASYLAALAALIAMRPRELHAGPRAVFVRSWHGIVDQLDEGLGYVRRTPPVLLGITVIGVVSTVGMNFQVLIPVLARDVLNGGAATYGFLMAGSGVGSLIGALLIAYSGRPALRLVWGGAAVFGFGLVALALSRSFVISLLLMGVLGISVIAMAATTNTYIQLTVPDELRGRVSSVYTTVFAGSTPIGGLFAGSIASAAGAPAALLIGGILSVLAALVAWLRYPGGRPSRERGAPSVGPLAPPSSG